LRDFNGRPMTHRRLLSATVIAAAIAAVPASAQGAEEVLAPVQNQSVLSAYGGHVVWNELDLASGRWFLIRWHAGVTSRLPVSSRGVPFDVDLGPDARGRPVAVYSRCRREPAAGGGLALSPDWMTAAGCDVYRVRLEGGQEQRVRSVSSRKGSETTPSIWRGRIAFAQRLPGRRRARLLLRRHGARRLVHLRGGTLPRCERRKDGRRKRRCDPRPYAGADALDLGPRSLAFLWRLSHGSVIGTGVGWELRSDPLSRRRGTLAASGFVGGACGFETPVSPIAVGRSVLFLDRIGRCRTTKTLFEVFHPRRRSRRQAKPSSGFARALARSGRALYWIRGPRPEPQRPPSGDLCRSAQGACVLVRSRDLRFKPAPRKKVEPPTL
jgi:hypothetical protein